MMSTRFVRKRLEPSRLLAMEVVKVVDLVPILIDPTSGESVRLRVEVHRVLGRSASFTTKVWRIEFYRVRPSFAAGGTTGDEDPVDEQILVLDHTFTDRVRARTVNGALKAVERMITGRFFAAQVRPPSNRTKLP